MALVVDVMQYCGHFPVPTVCFLNGLLCCSVLTQDLNILRAIFTRPDVEVGCLGWQRTELPDLGKVIIRSVSVPNRLIQTQ